MLAGLVCSFIMFVSRFMEKHFMLLIHFLNLRIRPRANQAQHQHSLVVGRGAVAGGRTGQNRVRGILRSFKRQGVANRLFHGLPIFIGILHAVGEQNQRIPLMQLHQLFPAFDVLQYPQRQRVAAQQRQAFRLHQVAARRAELVQ